MGQQKKKQIKGVQKLKYGGRGDTEIKIWGREVYQKYYLQKVRRPIPNFLNVIALRAQALYSTVDGSFDELESGPTRKLTTQLFTYFLPRHDINFQSRLETC